MRLLCKFIIFILGGGGGGGGGGPYCIFCTDARACTQPFLPGVCPTYIEYAYHPLSPQVPDDLPLLKDAFDAVHDLIITKPALYDRLVSV